MDILKKAKGLFKSKEFEKEIEDVPISSHEVEPELTPVEKILGGGGVLESSGVMITFLNNQVHVLDPKFSIDEYVKVEIKSDSVFGLTTDWSHANGLMLGIRRRYTYECSLDLNKVLVQRKDSLLDLTSKKEFRSNQLVGNPIEMYFH